MNAPLLSRATLATSRLLDFCSIKELTAQTGHGVAEWPLVVLKELVDNALDACEEARVAPDIEIVVGDHGIMVNDNGPGLPQSTIESILDFSVRVSSREAYVAPDRGAQGNALKTLVAMPFVLNGERGQVTIRSRGVRHEIEFAVDPIRQQPMISRQRHAEADVKTGTSVTIVWPDSACSMLRDARARFLQIAEAYAWLNPHLALTVEWFGDRTAFESTDRAWPKWLPSDPTSPHWYGAEHLARLIAGYIALDLDAGADRTVREFASEFRGLAGSAKQKAVLHATGLSGASLSSLCNGSGMDNGLIGALLEAMQANSRPIKPQQLGIIGKDHLQHRFEGAGCEMERSSTGKLSARQAACPGSWRQRSAGAPRRHHAVS